ncbi:uncharacterized protein J3R85_017794 [Psidium guajava]|nr:uncharacterized protein J3R85_017794 [Psidium guajava]
MICQKHKKPIMRSPKMKLLCRGEETEDPNGNTTTSEQKQVA